MITGTIFAILFFFFGHRLKGKKMAYFFGDKFKVKIKIPQKLAAKFEEEHPNAKNVSWYGHSNEKFEVCFKENDILKNRWFNDNLEPINEFKNYKTCQVQEENLCNSSIIA